MYPLADQIEITIHISKRLTNQPQEILCPSKHWNCLITNCLQCHSFNACLHRWIRVPRISFSYPKVKDQCG
ncbi:hypothetical protein Hdeb2414_s0023g00630641 [Helianthus debilis subsp. tardiflorus]